MTQQEGSPYPVQFSVEYPDRDLNRLTTFLRPFAAIPILIVLASVTGARWGWDDVRVMAFGSEGLLFVGPLLMILIRQKYPRWWFDWNRELLRFCSRVIIYLGLMDDRYPATDHPQSVRLDFAYPDVRQDLNRWLPLIKWLLAIPHYFVLAFLDIAILVAVVIAWFAILFTGRYPRGLFDFVEGGIAWNNRVLAYAFLLVTDRYPPFSLEG